jgi:hypothetical protein
MLMGEMSLPSMTGGVVAKKLFRSVDGAARGRPTYLKHHAAIKLPRTIARAPNRRA